MNTKYYQELKDELAILKIRQKDGLTNRHEDEKIEMLQSEINRLQKSYEDDGR